MGQTCCVVASWCVREGWKDFDSVVSGLAQADLGDEKVASLSGTQLAQSLDLLEQNLGNMTSAQKEVLVIKLAVAALRRQPSASATSRPLTPTVVLGVPAS